MKKRVSSTDLSWMIFDRMREELGDPRSVSVAVVRDKEQGWRAIVPARSAHYLSPDAKRKLRSIEDKFRSNYSLAAD